MKIKCDVCDKHEATVFCTADEASLCSNCDHQVHHANKLASKHLRFSLLSPSLHNTSHPLCDICQVKKAFLFCQQDRAILCKDCDLSIHTINEHTKKHDRFLLTGVKLSSTSSVYKPSSSSSSNQDYSVPLSSISNPSLKSNKSKIQPCDAVMISEYLIDTLPGWCVEDILDSSLPPSGFSKSGDDDGVLPYMEAEDNNTVSLQSKSLGIWVPQIQQTDPSSYTNQYKNVQFGIYNKETSQEVQSFDQQGQNSKRLYDDGGFTVPQINASTNTTFTYPNKNIRSFW